MDFDEAIQAHAAWKIKLSIYLRQNDGSLTAAEVRDDNRCPLGAWLHGEGRKYSSIAEYQTLMDKHARFHHAAGDVIEKVNGGEEINSVNSFGADSDYDSASSNVVKAIIELKKKVPSP